MKHSKKKVIKRKYVIKGIMLVNIPAIKIELKYTSKPILYCYNFVILAAWFKILFHSVKFQLKLRKLP